tara:strand:- start:2044 stop:2835 length:792 start_codon:yes stop_codon:yes gene_type:complete
MENETIDIINPLNDYNLELGIIENEQEEKFCRICLESENPEELISPCLCSGTQKYVHKYCLNTWRYQDTQSDNFIRCNECRTEFKIKKREYTKTALLFKKIFVFLKKKYLILSILIITLNSLIGYGIYNIINQDFYIYLNFYVLGAIFNSILQTLYLILLILLKCCSTYLKNIFKLNKKLQPTYILFSNLINLLLYFYNDFIGIILNLIIFKNFYEILFDVHIKNKFIEEEDILEFNSDDNLEHSIYEDGSEEEQLIRDCGQV